jgi:hypothetical protein
MKQAKRAATHQHPLIATELKIRFNQRMRFDLLKIQFCFFSRLFVGNTSSTRMDLLVTRQHLTTWIVKRKNHEEAFLGGSAVALYRRIGQRRSRIYQ